MSPPADHILTLVRRRDYLVRQILERGEKPGYDFRTAEKEALDWAISKVTDKVIMASQESPVTWVVPKPEIKNEIAKP